MDKNPPSASKYFLYLALSMICLFTYTYSIEQLIDYSQDWGLLILAVPLAMFLSKGDYKIWKEYKEWYDRI